MAPDMKGGRKGECTAYLVNRSVISGFGDQQAVMLTEEALRSLVDEPEDAIPFRISRRSMVAAEEAIAYWYQNPSPRLRILFRQPAVEGSLWSEMPGFVRDEIEEAIKPLQLL